MKIATFNINNINKRLAVLLRWLREARPDVVCLQELKAADREFPAAALEKAGYRGVWRGEKSWNGVAILSSGAEPVVTRTDLPGDASDRQSRYIEAAVRGVLIASLYAPNGNPQPGPKFDYKLAWMRRLAKHARALHAADVPVVLAGDYNVVPTDFDIYQSKFNSYADNALVQPQSRAAFARLLEQGWIDSIRALHPDTPMYTFWDYMRNRWPRDAGLRLDHLLLSPKAQARLASAGVDRAVRGLKDASDHAPAWVVLRDQVARARGKAAAKSAAAPRPGPVARKRAKAAERRPLLVIDGDSFAHRSYHALPKTILTGAKRPAGAILGFANFLMRIYQAEQPRAVIVCWDTLGAPTYRTKALPGYQGGRDFDDAIVEQLKIIPKLVAACGFANAKGRGFEADDFVAAAVVAEEKRGGRALVASGDRDMFQLASARTTILYPVRAGETARIGPAQVRERYGVDPEQVTDFIALRGDPSDRIPGAPQLGAEGAAALLQKHGTLEGVLAAGRYSGHADKLRLYRRIATMDRNAPLPPLKDQTPTWEKAAAMAQKLGLAQLARRLTALMP